MRARTALGRLLVAATALAAVAVGVSPSSTSAAPLNAGDPPTAGQTLSPLNGNSGTVFTLGLTGTNTCPGDTASNGYNWSTYIVSAGVDAALLRWNSSGPVLPAGAPSGSVTVPLFSSTGDPVISRTTSVVSGLITPIPTMSFAVLPPGTLPAGEYKLGFACHKDGFTERYWQTLVTITDNPAGGPAQFDYAFGARPAAPVLNPLTPGDGELSGTFTHAASQPATTAYTVTATPQGGGSAVTLPLAAGATSFTLTGLTNGTTYDVSLVATNANGNSPASNTVAGTPAPAIRPAVTNLVQEPGANQVRLTWTAPAGPAPIGFEIEVEDAVSGTPLAGSPFSAPAGATQYVVTGTPGVYSCTVTPLHPSPFVAASATVTPCIINNDTLIIQEITVERPVGALVLTQRCGVNGALPVEPASPGFPELPAVPASANQIGTSPTLGPDGTGGPDPEFGDYPYADPATYPTYCGVDLGTAQLVTEGALAGQYFAADGYINEVTVLETRDTDPGWTVNGTMGDFLRAGGGASFSGNYLGWSPVVSDDSDPTLTGYDQVVTAGARVLPDATTGLATPKVLAEAEAGEGIGIAELDARLKLLIPLTVPNGTYEGTLTFTAI